MRLLGQGREAEVFELDDGRALRLFRDGFGTMLETEEAALRAAHAGDFRVPTVYERRSVDGRPGLVMERIDGRDQMTRLERQPWRVLSTARGLGRIHASLATIAAPPALTPVHTALHARIKSAPHLSGRLADGARTELDRLPQGDRLLHGDFHPGNVLAAVSGPVVIDWTNATRGHPDADVARSRLIMRLGAMPPGTSRFLRSVDRLGRAGFVRGHVSGYRRVRPFDESSVQRWMVPHAAARLAENIPEEVEALLRYLESRLPG